ncbi:transmembrane protein [Ceratobasidium sp. AG-Ba]|nr:transmembrane protein [Ceratobasidium sp. AG-Ba]
MFRSCLFVLAYGWYAAGQNPNIVRVDDSTVYSSSNPSGIQFTTTGWTSVASGDATQRYGGTYTQSGVYGSRLWFAFRGRGITYYADQPPGFGAVTVSIDGGPNLNLNWTNSGTKMLYQQDIWGIQGLNEGDHAVVIGNTNLNNRSIGLDYFTVSPWEGDDITPTAHGPGASNVTKGAVLVDNESSEIAYSGSAWDSRHLVPNATAQALFFNGTEHCSVVPGSVASFIFNGTTLCGYRFHWTLLGTLSISPESELAVTALQLTQKMFWSVSGLEPKPHTVTITHAGTGEEYACLDYFMYLPSSVALSTSSSTKAIPVAAIVVAVSAGVTLLIILIILAAGRGGNREYSSGFSCVCSVE